MEYTDQLKLRQPHVGMTDWGDEVNANTEVLDSLMRTALSGLRVVSGCGVAHDTGLDVDVAAGTLETADGTEVAVAGGSLTLTDDAVVFVYATTGGSIGYDVNQPPAGAAVLAVVDTESGSVVRIGDMRWMRTHRPEASGGVPLYDHLADLAAVDPTDMTGDDRAQVMLDGTFCPYRLYKAVSLSDARPYIVQAQSSTDAWIMQIPFGDLERPAFGINATTPATDIDISAGKYPIITSGGDPLMAVIIDDIIYRFTSLAANDWSYLYIDTSDIQANNHAIIDEGELYDGTDEPVWDSDRRGWYHPTNTDDLCIFAVRADGSAVLYPFYHDGGVDVEYSYEITESTVKPGTSFTSFGPLTVPSFVTRAVIMIAMATTSTVIAYARPNGSSDAVGALILKGINKGNFSSVNYVFLSSSQQVDMRVTIVPTTSYVTHTRGFCLPIGM